MSEENNSKHTQPLETEPLSMQHMRKTSSVPLRKETVRVTLKSTPAGAKAPAPAAAAPQAPSPSAPVPTAMTRETSAQPTKAPAPSASNQDIPDVTSAVPLKQETMRVTLKADVSPNPEVTAAASQAPAPAPTIPIGGASSGPRIAAPAPTVPLNVGASATGPATIPLATQPLGNASQPLPKATVQLTQTQQLGQPGTSVAGSQSPTIQTVIDEDSSAERASNVEVVLVVVAFLFALFLLFAQFQRASIWINEHENGSFGVLFS